MRPEYTINPERRALYRRQGFWGDATLADYWHQSVRAVPDRTCVVDSQGGRYTYAQLDKKAQRLAGWMRTIGVGRGDVVALNLAGLGGIHHRLCCGLKARSHRDAASARMARGGTLLGARLV